MTTPAATRRNTIVGWLLIFLAIGVVVAAVSANAVKDSADDSTTAVEPGPGSRGTRVVPNGVTDSPTEANAASTDQNDPSRFRIVADGVLEDAATGIRRRVDGVRAGEQAPSNDAIREFNSVNSDLRSDLSVGFAPEPARLVVESINVDAEVIPIGLDPNKALAVPKRADITGWWSGGFSPGEFGPTVIVGHYDSKVAPGVFARLKDVQERDLITVVQTDGSKYVYEVEFVERLHKTDFPTESVYGPTDGSTLRLVTCGGKFDHKTRHYVDNVIVYASLIRTEGLIDPGSVGRRSSAFGPDSLSAPNVPPGGFGESAGADASTSTIEGATSQRATVGVSEPTTSGPGPSLSSVPGGSTTTTPITTAPIPTTTIPTTAIPTTTIAVTTTSSSIASSTTSLPVASTLLPLPQATELPASITQPVDSQTASSADGAPAGGS